MNTKRLLSTAAAVLVGAALLPTAQAVAGDRGTPEAGCYDVTTATTARFSSVISDVTLTSPVGSTAVGTEIKKSYFAGAGDALADVVLGAASCVEATYTLNIYPAGTDLSSRRHAAPLATVSRSGVGELAEDNGGDVDSPFKLRTLVDQIPAADGKYCVGLRVEVRDAGGNVVDVAPDISTESPTGLETRCNDGNGNNSGGGQGFGG